MQRYSEAAWERVMKVQEVILRAMAKRITREVGGADWADREHALARNAGGTTLTIVGASVFHYNPLLGNLLLDMTLSGASPDTNIALDVENFSSVMSRAAPGLSDPFNLGLVTEFSTTAPPPPPPAAQRSPRTQQPAPVRHRTTGLGGRGAQEVARVVSLCHFALLLISHLRKTK